MAAAIWWLFITLNAYLTIVSEQTLEQTEHYERYYHLVAWAVPTVFLFFILLPADKIGFPGYSSMWCWVKSDDNAFWQFAFFYTEVGYS